MKRSIAKLAAKVPPPRPPVSLHIANLGSSFASGPGIPPVVDKAAYRSGANFGSLSAKRIGARLTDLSVGGSTLLNLLNEPQYSGGKTFAPQVDDLPADAHVVLVLSGGNDIGYIGGFFADTLNSWFWGLGSALTRLYAYSRDVKWTTDLSTEELAERYGRALDAIHAKAPSAKVIVVEYFTMLGPDTEPGKSVPFGADRIEHHKAVAARLLDATHRAVQGRSPWCTKIGLAAASESRALGSPEPWVSGFNWKLFRDGAAYHPNAEGMKGAAELVHRKFIELGIIKDDS
ncbi:SGNH hydrolase-type esterase domain-containing protein [Biscogniauxia mediterranea]|nr:SGNH hydrolase-type esterase domain-containing protein [Biscogniauxia mediterranea]